MSSNSKNMAACCLKLIIGGFSIKRSAKNLLINDFIFSISGDIHITKQKIEMQSQLTGNREAVIAYKDTCFSNDYSVFQFLKKAFLQSSVLLDVGRR